MNADKCLIKDQISFLNQCLVDDKKKVAEEQVYWSTSLSTDTSGYTSTHRGACGTPAESGQEDLTNRRAYIEPRKTQQDEGTGGDTGVLAGLALPLAGGGTEVGVRPPHWGNCLSQRRDTEG